MCENAAARTPRFETPSTCIPLALRTYPTALIAGLLHAVVQVKEVEIWRCLKRKPGGSSGDTIGLSKARNQSLAVLLALGLATLIAGYILWAKVSGL